MKEKILIIEDDPLIRNELKTLLQSNGYETVAPENFSDVIDRIKAEQPHLILLVMAFLISPMGLPLAAIWLLGKVQSLKFAIQELVYG